MKISYIYIYLLDIVIFKNWYIANNKTFAEYKHYKCKCFSCSFLFIIDNVDGEHR